MSRMCGIMIQNIPSWPPGLPQNRPYCQSQLSQGFHWIVVHTHLQGGVAQTAPRAPERGGQPPTQPSRAPGGPLRVCAWRGTPFKIFLRGPPGYPKTIHIATVNSRRFSIGLWCTRTFRGGWPRRRPEHPRAGISHPHNPPGRRGGPPACVLGGGRLSKHSFVAPRATPKPSILPESTLAGFPLDCGAHAPSGGGRPDSAPHTPKGVFLSQSIFKVTPQATV